jgi:6-phosphogluconolactonase (cycloisomerase 2 family)
VTAHPTLPVAYATNENVEGAVTAVGPGPGGQLSMMGEQPTGGADPCHATVVGDGRFLVVANYSGGSVAVFPLDDEGRPGARTDLVLHHGSGPVPERQTSAHPHMVVPDGPDTLVVVDLGADELVGYRIGGDGRLHQRSLTPLPPGTGPRQLVRAGTRWLLAAELSAELMVLTGDAETGFTVGAAVAASARPGPNQPAQLTVTSDGTVALLSNRGPDTVSVFDVSDTSTARAALLAETEVGPGWPRHLCLLADGARSVVMVALQQADLVREFRLDPASGALTAVAAWPTGSPTCLLPLRG